MNRGKLCIHLTLLTFKTHVSGHKIGMLNWLGNMSHTKKLNKTIGLKSKYMNVLKLKIIHISISNGVDLVEYKLIIRS